MDAVADRGMPMKLEGIAYSAVAIATAMSGEALNVPEQQQIALWSVAGTVVGACIAAIQMPAGTTGAQRAMRAVVSLLAGLLIAPYAVAYMPRPEQIDAWWHSFAASGIAAALAYVIATEAPKLLRSKIRERSK